MNNAPLSQFKQVPPKLIKRPSIETGAPKLNHAPLNLNSRPSIETGAPKLKLAPLN